MDSFTTATKKPLRLTANPNQRFSVPLQASYLPIRPADSATKPQQALSLTSKPAASASQVPDLGKPGIHLAGYELVANLRCMSSQLDDITADTRESMAKLEAENRGMRMALEVQAVEHARKLDENKKALAAREKRLARYERRLMNWERALTEKERKLEEKKEDVVSTETVEFATTLTAKVTTLQREVLNLRKIQDINKPLLDVGIAVRLRFLEEAKTKVRGLEDKLVARHVIRAGIKAVHNGNFAADSALFLNGSLQRSDSTLLVFKATYRGEPAEDKWTWVIEGYHDCEGTLKTLKHGRSDAYWETMHKFRLLRDEYMAMREAFRFQTLRENGRASHIDIGDSVKARSVLAEMEELVVEIADMAKKENRT